MARLLRFGFALLLAAVLQGGPLASQNGPDRARAWLETEIWPRAAARGISRNTFTSALGNFRAPTQGTPDDPNTTQAEFDVPSNYFDEARLGLAAETGRELAATRSAALAAAERKTGVPARIVLAIWSRESAYGDAALTHNAFEALAARAYSGPRRPFFTSELLSALELAERSGRAPGSFHSNSIGAMGQPQFMPSSAISHARDGDGDGVADIWNSEADTIASIASFLAGNGWVRGRDWGFEVVVPENVSCALEGPDNMRPIRDWVAMGVRRISGRAFPDHELAGEGFLVMPAGRYGPAFIATPNFTVLKRYNNSDLYALYVGNLADRIAYGMPAFRGGWRLPRPVSRRDIATLQSRLNALGHDTGGRDGLAGFRTRRSIGAWQTANARRPTCYPAPGMRP